MMENITIADNLYIRFFSDGAVVFNETTGDTHKLDILTGEILSYLDSPMSVDSIKSTLRVELSGQSTVDIDEYIIKALNMLSEYCLVEVDERRVE